jgi:hypothetical protein
VSEARLKQQSGKVEWVQRSRDNHFFDCEAMQAAAGYLLNVQRIPLKKSARAEALPNPQDGTRDSVGRQPETPPEVFTPPIEAPIPSAAVARSGRRGRRIIRSSYLGA